MTWILGTCATALALTLVAGTAIAAPPAADPSPPAEDNPDPTEGFGPPAGDQHAPAGASVSAPPAGRALLESLAAEEREREASRAAAEAADAAEERRRRREREEALGREAEAAIESERASARRGAAMLEWHAGFATALEPILDARAALYRRLPTRRFARLRPHCEAVASAADAAARSYAPAPERPVDVLARDLLAVYLESARHCAAGAYFSFTVEERRIGWLAAELIEMFEPFGATFERAATQRRNGRPTHGGGGARSSDGEAVRPRRAQGDVETPLPIRSTPRGSGRPPRLAVTRRFRSPPGSAGERSAARRQSARAGDRDRQA